jgi:hypothetical protein
MSETRKRPGIAFWVTVATVCLLLLYPLSFGPWCWFAAQQAEIGSEVTRSSLYRPILWAWFHNVPAMSSAIGWYANLASPSELYAGKEDDGTLCVVSLAPPP